MSRKNVSSAVSEIRESLPLFIFLIIYLLNHSLVLYKTLIIYLTEYMIIKPAC